MLSKFFIERPVLSNVIACVMMLLGAVAIATLPVSQYPAITPPTIQVTASYPGARARTMADKVAIPIEQAVNGVKGMLYMQSSCTNRATITSSSRSDIGTDPNEDQILVQNRVSQAQAQLPQAVQAQGVVTQTKSTAILQIITLTSPSGKFDGLFLNNYAAIYLQNELERIDGVGGVTVFGVGPYSMRVWLDPGQMQARSLVPNDVIDADQGAERRRYRRPARRGARRAGPGLALTVNVNGPLDAPEEFGNIIVKSDTQNGGRITRLRDVGRVEMGSQHTASFSNTTDTRRRRRDLPAPRLELPPDRETRAREDGRAREGVPDGLRYEIPFDTRRSS